MQFKVFHSNIISLLLEYHALCTRNTVSHSIMCVCMEYSRMNAMKTNRCWNNIGFFRRCRSSSRDISCRCIRFECDTCDEGSTEAPPLLIELLRRRRRIVFYFARTVGRLDNPFCGLWPFRSSVSFFFFFLFGYRVFARPDVLISIKVFNVLVPRLRCSFIASI